MLHPSFRQKVKTSFVSVLMFPVFSLSALADEPAGYYDDVDTSSSQALRDTLHEIIDDHQRYPYTSSATDTWDILEEADEDSSDSGNVVDVYLNESYDKEGGGNSYYNREHSWPKSYGFPDNDSSNYPYTDAHHLFIANSSYNSSRSNKPYADCSSSCTEKTTVATNGQGGSSSESNWTEGSGSDGSWETWTGRRGDVARALMYLAVRYEGGTHGDTGYSEPDLVLTDDRDLIGASNQGENILIAYMGLKSVLLQWHEDDPVDDVELARNDVIYAYQGNRNPFIDRPEYVACVFDEDCSGSDSTDGDSSSDSDDSDSSSDNTEVWINEFHYDNSGSDTGEFVEVAGTSGTDLTDWTVLAYNGNGGGTYKTISLSGSIPAQQSGFGTLSFDVSGLQNGSSDGLALVDADGEVVQFLSYEGIVTATDGAADGMTSTDVGVAETSTTSSGYSLQLGGSGSSYDDFSWQSAQSDTAGAVNTGQTFN